jgi:hypothetical protein
MKNIFPANKRVKAIQRKTKNPSSYFRVYSRATSYFQ